MTVMSHHHQRFDMPDAGHGLVSTLQAIMGEGCVPWTLNLL